MTKVQRFVRTAGAVYLVLGTLGFMSALGGTTSQTSNNLFGLVEVTVISNIIHLGMGAAFWASGDSRDLARTISILLGVVGLLMFVLGILGIESIDDLIGNSVAGSTLQLATAGSALFFVRIHPSPLDGTV